MNVKKHFLNERSNAWRRLIGIMVTIALLFTTFTSIKGANSAEKVSVFIISDASDGMVNQEPVSWAIGQLKDALQKKGIDSEISFNLEGIHNPGERIVVTPGESKLAHDIASQSGVTIPTISESFALIKGLVKNEKIIMATGFDARGLTYAILELADRITYSENPINLLKEIENSVEQPVNSIRSMTRLFVSEIEDKSWFYDKDFWESYLSMLMNQRFNRFSLTLGLGYDSPNEVLDSYFIFAYPFLVSVPEYNVKVKGLPSGEQEKNLEMLKFISSEAARRGLHFQLGLWGHAYECTNSPEVNYVIEGLNQETHADYCQKALKTLLQACPDINGITFRAHYESGIKDGSKSFWETVFKGVAECGRRVEIDLHAKGISYSQVEMALNTGQPVLVSPKLSAEHMGLPAHQAAIREIERTPSSTSNNPRNSISRYSYSDFLSNDRDYGILFRIWPGMQKILLWGDPALAAGYGHYAGFCGSLGIEVCDPLCFKGRQGTGVSAERQIYVDESLIPEGGSWRKYLYTYRIWGRHLYNPDTDPESYRRFLRSEYGEAAASIEKALGNSSRIIPLITSSHSPAISAMTYWPEMYTNIPITNSGIPHPYGDTPSPKVFGRVSPLDPAMFSPVNEFVDDIINRVPSSRYSAVDVAQWLENFATTSKNQLSIAKQKVNDANDASFRRVFIDASVQNELGIFWAQKLRATVAYTLYEKKSDLDYLRDAVYFYQSARDAWKRIIELTKNVYVDKLDFGRFPHIRGNWSDRLPAIEQDLSFMEKMLRDKIGNSEPFPDSPSSSASGWLRLRPQIPQCQHNVPKHFIPGKSIEIVLNSKSSKIKTVKLHYRHVNQVEAYNILPMTNNIGTWSYSIPGDFTNSQYPLMYFFEFQDTNGNGWYYPGFNEELANQPYFNIMRVK